MGNLSQFNKTETDTVAKIMAAWKKRGDSETPRRYLGASILGNECDRHLWYEFRNCTKPEFTGQLYRLFNTGHCEEARFIKDLQAIGVTVHDRGEDGEQIGVSDVGGHFKGHLDGVGLGIPEAPKTWHLLEFKTHNSKSFEKLQSEGVKKSKPVHYVQMQVYMRLAKLDRALYLAVNKNTDELYSERIEYSATESKAYMARAERIIKASQPPERFASRPDTFQCKWCNNSDLCWGTGQAALAVTSLSCRTCCHSTPEMSGDGRWSCSFHKKDDIDSQKVCPNHLVIPALLTFCSPVDSGDDWIKFQNIDGSEWIHGGEGGFSSKELTKLPASGIATAFKAKEVLGATVTGFEVPKLNLIEQYDPKDSRLVWEGKPADCPRQDGKITGVFKDAKHIAEEYDGKWLRVEYVGQDYAAIWELVE